MKMILKKESEIQAYEKACKKEKGKYNCDPLYLISSEEISEIINKCTNGSKSKDERCSCIKSEIGKEIKKNELKLKHKDNEKGEK